MALEIDGLLRFATEAGASDVFLKENTPPTLRLNGSVRKLDHPPLMPEEIEGIAKMMMPDKDWLRLGAIANSIFLSCSWLFTS